MKTILITGTTSGIGLALANYLTEKGYRVIGTGRNPDPDNFKFDTISLDITSQTSVDRAFDHVTGKYQKIDVLINNAGYGILGSVEDCTIEEARQQLETNYFGTLRMIQKFIPHFREQSSGLIINIGSIGGIISLPYQAHYSASKFALEALTEALRFELKDQNIKVCNINPGDFKTGFTAHRKMASKTNPVYQKNAEHFLKIYEHDEQNGSDPKKIAVLVEKIIRKNRTPSIRYPIGMPLQTAAVYLKRWLGGNIFERILKIIWK